MTIVREIRTRPALSRLLAVRLCGQTTDGLFQAALGGAILFNPERHADPVAIAGGLAVLLLPYSIIGPFAGALLDHWDRRTVLIWSNLARALLIMLTAVAIATGGNETLVLIAALTVTGASRFVASGLSASLPHVTSTRHLVAMNAFFTTIGSVALAVGAGLALGLRAVFGNDNTGSAATTMGALVLAVAGAAVAARFRPRALGPDHPDVDGAALTPEHPNGPALRAVAVGLAHGARAVGRAHSIAAALCAVGAHRFVFGVNTLMLLVLTRDTSLGLAGVGAVAGLTAVGMFAAAVITPWSVARRGRRATISAALVIAVVAELALASFNGIVICVVATVLGLAGQTLKLCADAAMQLEADDAVRGQVFAFQDAVFNVTYVAAVTIAAFTVPADGRALLLPLVGALIYAVSLLLVRRLHPRCDTPDAPAGYTTAPPRSVHRSATPSPSTSSSTASAAPSPSVSTNTWVGVAGSAPANTSPSRVRSGDPSVDTQST
nr:MFS transporter [Williamsia sp. CHRR-6]